MSTVSTIFSKIAAKFSAFLTFSSADLTGSCDEELDIHVTGAVAEQATLGFEKETYPNETDCTYVIRTLPNLRIQVSIKIFFSR